MQDSAPVDVTGARRQEMVMAVVQIASAPSRDLYQQVLEVLDLDGDRPAGLILHAASELPSGEIQIFDVYETAEQLQAFAESRLFPVFEKLGVMDQVLAAGPPEPHEAFHL